MGPELWAKLILAAYVAIALAVVVAQALRCRAGWRVWLLYAALRAYLGLAFRWRANRRCPFPSDGPALIIANHRSPLDPLALWMNHHLGTPGRRIRTVSFIMAREYYNVPGVHWICEVMQAIPVVRGLGDPSSVRRTIRQLRRGEWVGIFPEGRIGDGAALHQGHSGVAWLALTTQVPVYPVFIHNAPRGRSMVEPFYNFGRIRVTYGDPIDLTAYYGKRKTDELLGEVTDLLMRRLAALGGVVYCEPVQDAHHAEASGLKS